MAPTNEPSHRPLSLRAGLFTLMLSAVWSGNPAASHSARGAGGKAHFIPVASVGKFLDADGVLTPHGCRAVSA